VVSFDPELRLEDNIVLQCGRDADIAETCCGSVVIGMDEIRNVIARSVAVAPPVA